jgi:type IV secretory pathway protease TraF
MRTVVRELFGNPLVWSCYILLAYTITRPYLTRNVTGSLAPGYYWCQPSYANAPLPPETIVLFTPTMRALETLQAVIPGIPAPQPWMKRTLGGTGSLVCATGNSVTLNNVSVAERPLRARYAFPPVEQCWQLGPDDLFVLGDHPQSVDSRYLGLIPRVSVHETCAPLWTWKDARHE